MKTTPILITITFCLSALAQDAPKPLTEEERQRHLPPLPPPDVALVDTNVVFQAVDGTVVIEAEHYHAQRRDQIRRWYLNSSRHTPTAQPDGDPVNVDGAGRGAYMEALPDTFVTEHDRPIDGLNLGLNPGSVAVLCYRVHFSQPGRYFVWTRSRSDDEEDNTLSIGLNDRWPDSGRILQFPTNRRQWIWNNQLRQAAPGESDKRAFLDVPTPGIHTVMYSMREDGNSFDRFILTTDPSFAKPEGVGPAPTPPMSGRLPDPIPEP